MRLKYKPGYFVVVLITTIGLVLAFMGVDENKYIMLTGSLGLALFGIYSFIKVFHINHSKRQWGALSACLFILLLIGIHFMLNAKIDYFIIIGLFFIRSLYENPKKNKIMTA
jgi:hypothetical protein